MKVISSDCIILRNRDFKERDRLVTFLARDKGRMTGIARGARKPTARGVGAYEPCTRGTIFYVESRNSDLVSIRKCDPIPPYLLLTGDYDKLMVAGYLAELVELAAIAPDDAPVMYLLLSDALHGLVDATSTLMLSLTRLKFELGYLACLGLQPDLSRCSACGRSLFDASSKVPRPSESGDHAFDADRGGVICPRCLESGTRLLPLSAGTIAFLGAWAGSQAGGSIRPTRLALTELEAAISHHLVHHLERVPRSMALLPELDPPKIPSAGQ